jgi:hypothetical protein
MTGDTPDSLAVRLRPAEQALLIRTVGLIAVGRVALEPGGLELDRRPLRAPLQMETAGGFAGL